MAETVTIAKSHFEALCRRADYFQKDQTPDGKPSDNVWIPRAEHARLLRAEREYNILRTALFAGGLTVPQMNAILSNDTDPGAEQDGFVKVDPLESAFTLPQRVPVRITSPESPSATPQLSNNVTTATSYLNTRSPFDRKSSLGMAGSSFESTGQDDHFMPESTEAYAARAPYPRNDQRTILISNLSDRTTHKDLVDIIRGGRLLDMYLRTDRSATVSFVEGAADFVAYAKRKDFYLHGKRLEIRWNERQFHLPYHVANKVHSGATRNLVVRGLNSNPPPSRQAGANNNNNAERPAMDEQSIRDDLGHIHNLVVVSVSFTNGDCYISTNSVHNALFARTCMMSRARYKGLRIEWYPDECAGPIPHPPRRQLQQQDRSPPWRHAAAAAAAAEQQQQQPKKPAQTQLSNMFGVLDIDDDDDDDAEEAAAASDVDTGSELSMGTRHGGGIGLSWADNGIAA